MYRLFVRAAVVAACIPVAALAARAQSVNFSANVTPSSVSHGTADNGASVDFSPRGPISLDVSDPGASVSLVSYYLTASGFSPTTFNDAITVNVQLENAGETGTAALAGHLTGSASGQQNALRLTINTGAELSVLVGGAQYTFDQFAYTSAMLGGPFGPPSPGAVYARLRLTGEPSRGTAAGKVEASPTAIDGNVYFASDDGKLYATNAATGEPVPGFPITGTLPGKTLGRAAVYGNGGGKAVYLTSDTGFVTKVNADGSIAWSRQPLGAGGVATNASTPAVTPSGDVIVGLTGDAGSYVVDLDGATGDTVRMSPLLGGPGSSISAPAVDGSNVYVGLTSGTDGDIVLLNIADLTPRAGGGIAAGEGVTAPPYIKSMAMFVGTLAGNFYKVNSTTFSPDASFGLGNGGPGKAAVGQPLPTSAFPDDGSVLPAGNFYVGSTKGKIFAVNAVTGAVSTFLDTGDASAAVGGVVIDRTDGVLAFGTSAGVFYQVPLSDAGSFTQAQGLGPIHTTPTLDRASNAFLVGSDDGHVYAFPVL